MDPSHKEVTHSPSDDAGNAFICLNGSFTGDIWHCAAARILWEYHLTAEKENGLEFFNPVICMSIYGYGKEPAGACIKRGMPSYVYFAEIGLPCALIAVKGVEGDGEKSNNALTYKEVDVEWVKNQKVKLMEQIAKSGKFDVLFNDFLKGQKNPLSRTDQGPGVVPNLIPLWVSTTMVMRLVHHLGVENSLRILGERLSLGIERTKDLEYAVQVFKVLVGVLTEAQKKTDTRRTLLFNYRIGDVNKQHDSNDDILNQIKELAWGQRMVVVSVPMMKPEEFEARTSDKSKQFKYLANRENRDPAKKDWTFDLPTMPKRVSACFYRLVAQYLQLESKVAASDGGPMPTERCLHGLLGGRSGSMDLASFVGVKCLSWDEPLLTAKQYTQQDPDPQAYTAGDISSQGPQLLRLLNQRPIMSTCYLSLDGADLRSQVRRYKGLNVLDEVARAWFRDPDQVDRMHLEELYGNTLQSSKVAPEEKTKRFWEWKKALEKDIPHLETTYLEGYPEALEKKWPK